MRICFLAGLGMATLGCASEDAPYHTIPKIELKQASCLEDSLSKVERFFNGESTAKEVDEIWTCYSYALKTFHKYVKGSEEGRYLATELRNFLETYFLKEEMKRRGERHLISDALLDEMMGLKNIFLGGSRQALTRLELLATLDLIEDFRAITHDLLPHTRILFVRDSKHVPRGADYVAAETALSRATERLLKKLNPDGSRYEMASLARLMSELHLFFRYDNPDTTFGEIQKYIPLFSRAKNLLFNSFSDAIESYEWPLLGRLLTQVVGISLRSIYYFSTESLYDQDHLAQMREIFRLSTSVLRDSMKRRDYVPIPNSDIEALIKEYAMVHDLPLNLNINEAHKLYRLFVDFILNPQQTFASKGLSREKLDYLESEIEGWGHVQELLISDKEDSQSVAWQQMKGVLNTPWPLSLDDKGRVVLDGSASSTNLKGSSRLNWSRALFNVLFRAYVKDPNRLGERMDLDKAELRTAFLDLKPILVGLSLVHPEDKDFDQRLYRDTNLFMPRSDGNRFIGFYELIEYLHFVYSGIDAGFEFFNQSQDGCILPDDFMQVECFRSNLQVGASRFLEHLPYYLRYALPLSDKNWRRDIRNMEIVNRDEGAVSAPIEKGDVYATFVLLQYIDVFMLRFDVDRSGDIDLIEGIRAFKHIKDVLGDLLGQDVIEDEEELEALFTYMLKYGEVPHPSDPLASMRFNNWKYKKGSWKLAADRGILLQILASLQKLGSI